MARGLPSWCPVAAGECMGGRAWEAQRGRPAGRGQAPGRKNSRHACRAHGGSQLTLALVKAHKLGRHAAVVVHLMRQSGDGAAPHVGRRRHAGGLCPGGSPSHPSGSSCQSSPRQQPSRLACQFMRLANRCVSGTPSRRASGTHSSRKPPLQGCEAERWNDQSAEELDRQQVRGRGKLPRAVALL